MENKWNYNCCGNDWGGLCKHGCEQSPINLDDNIVINENIDLDIQFNHVTNNCQIKNTGYCLQFTSNDSMGVFKLKDKKYYIQQFHFHITSEHRINNKEFDMEMHIVGETNDNKKESAVIGILWKTGKHNQMLNDLGWTDDITDIPSPDKEGPYYKIIKEIKLHELNYVLKEKSFYHYSGSLTTPCCTENIKWIVYQCPLELSSNQLDYYHQVLKNHIPITAGNKYKNNRNIQAIGKRNIYFKR